MNEEQQVFYFLGVALAIGLLIGTERGWKERAAEEGSRIAGVRTFGLIGLLGGGSALLSHQLGPLALGFGFVAVAGAMTTAYYVHMRKAGDVGVTSLIAALVTFVLGALAALGEVAIASATAVIVTLLLSYKPLLHHWLGTLEHEELRAGLKLLLITIVLLPVLPDQGYGPWQALNPHTIWWMVVLIAMISFIGYFAIKLGGMQKGAVFTGLFGGLASSTAVTLHFSRMSRRDGAMVTMLAVGILLSCGTMYPRMLLVATLINGALFRLMLVPALVMALLTYLPALLYWYNHSQAPSDEVSTTLRNPLELKSALGFGVLLAIILLAGKALQIWFGEAGLLALAAASGITDVDAINLSLAGMTADGLAPRVAVMGVVIAASVNSLTKAGMAAVIGGRAIGTRVGLPLAISAGGGLLTTWLWVW